MVPAQAPPRSSGALPALGDTSELSASAERRIGDRIASSIYRDPDYLDDPVLGDYLQGIWQPLMTAARARGELGPELESRFAWDVMQIRDRSVNAFALPGGYLGVHMGLIAAVSTRDELASVLAHELTHVTQRHISRLMTNQMPWLVAAMILGALAASRNPELANAAITGGQAMAVQNQLNFSRDMEREADRVGFGIMAEAGFDQLGFAAMFDKLQQASRLNDNGSYPYLRSHPLTTERIAEVKGRLQLEGTPPAVPGRGVAEAGKARVLHAMMAARARVLGGPGVDGLRPLVVEAQALQPGVATASLSARDAGVLYGGALAASRLREHALARSLAARLKAATAQMQGLAEPADWLVLELELAAGNTATLPRLANTGSRAALLLQSRADLAMGRGAQEVSGALQNWVSNHPRDAIAWQLLATAYGQQGQTLRAIRADAESRVAQLDYGAARDRFRAAQDVMRSGQAGGTGASSYIDASIIDTRAREIDQLLREQALEEKLNR